MRIWILLLLTAWLPAAIAHSSDIVHHHYLETAQAATLLGLALLLGGFGAYQLRRRQQRNAAKRHRTGIVD